VGGDTIHALLCGPLVCLFFTFTFLFLLESLPFYMVWGDALS
jgi:hypothetical protein